MSTYHVPLESTRAYNDSGMGSGTATCGCWIRAQHCDSDSWRKANRAAQDDEDLGGPGAGICALMFALGKA